MSNWLGNYDLDIIGHEFTHGVVQHIAALGANVEGPAAVSEAETLNEHIADCFGIMLKHFINKQAAETGNWDFSPNVWLPFAMEHEKWTENYFRTFRIQDTSKSPDTGPIHWSEKEPFEKDGEPLDPHVNCGIASHAFYLAALQFKGNTWETVGRIWYNVLTDEDFTRPQHQTFHGWKILTMKHAERIFKEQGKSIVGKAWQLVGL